MATKKASKRRKRKLRLWAVLGALALLLLVILIVSIASCRAPKANEASDALWDGSWYEDDLGRIGSDGALVSGMKTFEKKTGVRPYLTILANVAPDDLDLYARDQYEALFSNGGHVLVVYDEWGENAYYLSARTGEGSSLQKEDIAELLAAIERAYADAGNGSYAAAFGAGFGAAGQAIAARSRRTGSGAVWLLLLAALLLTLSFGAIYFLRKRTKDRRYWDSDG